MRILQMTERVATACALIGITTAPIYLLREFGHNHVGGRHTIAVFFLLALAGCAALALIYLLLYWRVIFRSRSIFIALAIFSLLITMALGAFYFVESIKYLAEVDQTRSVQTDLAHRHMLIATSDIDSIYSEGSYSESVPIAQWERCALNAVACSGEPRTAYMKCKSNMLLAVNERDWPSFALVPRENAIGASPLKSMRLCDE
ncbi:MULTISPECIES: hypothetical protein [Cupriavidus]|uniref:hypothetical protein n=1 Tax=Cupriavidus TaxID=106589 RepID=UPI0002A29EF3|nr:MULTISPECIES: hypothetical protein [Cupriavidus]EKZ98340.1 hypothetical protein D769_15717 [Cupriavidus sp. HMR-1]